MINPSPTSVAERIVIAFFTALPPTLMALAAVIYAMRAYRQARDAYLKVDSRMDQLLEAERQRARLEGVLEQQASGVEALPPARPPSHTERGYPRGPRTDLPPPPDAPGRSGGHHPPHE